MVLVGLPGAAHMVKESAYNAEIQFDPESEDP